MALSVMIAVFIAALGLGLLGLWVAARTHPVVDLTLLLTAGSLMGAPLFRIDAGPLPLTLMRLMLLMMVARTIWLATRGQINWPRLSVLDFCWFAYLLVITFSLVTSDWAYNHRQPVSTWLFFYLLPTVVYLIARTTRLDLRHLHAASLVLLIFGGYLGTLAILETQGPHALVFPRYIQSETYWEFLGRARGPFLNPVINGIMMTVCMVVALVWWPALKTTGKTLVAVYCLLMLVGVFLTYTRSCWLACGVALAIMLWQMTSWRMRWIGMTWGVLAVAILGMVTLEQVKSFKRDRDVSKAEMAKSASLRPLLAKVAFDMFEDRPLMGVGLGQYTRWNEAYVTQNQSQMPLQKVRRYVQHNTLLASLVETGLLGAITLLAFTAGCFYLSVQLWLQPNSAPTWRAIGTLLATTTSVIAINGIFHDVMIIVGVKIWWLAMAGIAANAWQVSKRPATQQTRTLLTTPPQMKSALKA